MKQKASSDLKWMELCSSGMFKIKPKINALCHHWQERRQGGQRCLGLTVLPQRCSFITKADPYFRCQAGDEPWTRWIIFTCSCWDWPGLPCSGAHTSADHTGFWQWQAGRRRWARTVDQPALNIEHLPRHFQHLESHPPQLCIAHALIHTQQIQSHIGLPTENIHPHILSSFS